MTDPLWPELSGPDAYLTTTFRQGRRYNLSFGLVVEANFLSDAEKQAILGGNLHRLLRIEAG